MVIVRIVSPDHGTKRIHSKTSEKICEFYKKVEKEFNLHGVEFCLYHNREGTLPIPVSKKTLNAAKINHGDMIFMSNLKGNDVEMKNQIPSASTSAGPSAPSPSLGSVKSASVFVREDKVDQILDKMDGKIQRKRNEQLCHHGPSGKCLHCASLEPYDEGYLNSQEPPIKSLSFHSYIRKLRGGVDKGKFAMLENISCKIKPGCQGHPPWPEGICTKCQPNAVTLNRQIYRHVDYIQFENPSLVERFLNYWRSTGNQRIGILYGRYEVHKNVPLGIKAVVAAIYEPPQVSARNSIQLLEDEQEDLVNKLAAAIDLVPVGWCFTDLEAQDLSTGTVKFTRGHVDSHFLSAEECILAADFQNKHVNPCKLSPDGHFGSKFVTVVVTGDTTNQIHFEGYQVSNQAMALVRDDCLVPTKDVPELGYVKESSNSQYVPDVFYKEKDKYGNDVTQLARPLPVEYLLLDIPAAFPVDQMFTFHSENSRKPFPVENRAELGEIQDFNAFMTYMQQYDPTELLSALSNFHLLIFLATCDMLPLKEHMEMLLEAVKTKDENIIHDFAKSEEWATVQELMAAHGPSPPTSRQTSYQDAPLPPIGGAAGAIWTCEHCTYHNQADRSTCEMCGLPKN